MNFIKNENKIKRYKNDRNSVGRNLAKMPIHINKTGFNSVNNDKGAKQVEKSIFLRPSFFLRFTYYSKEIIAAERELRYSQKFST